MKNETNETLEKLLSAARCALELRDADEAKAPPPLLIERVAAQWCAEPDSGKSILCLLESSAFVGAGLAAAACVCLAFMPNFKLAKPDDDQMLTFEALILGSPGEEAGQAEWRGFF